jgi:hypothetical protein
LIRGYPDVASVVAGDDLVLRACTDAPAFRVDMYRYGTGMRHVASCGPLEGRSPPDHLPYQNWGDEGEGLQGEPLAPWPAYRLPIPGDWRSGVYVAVLVEGEGRRGEEEPDARSGRALFVVRNPRPGNGASILYKLPLFTYHAYNCTSRSRGWSLYTVPEPRHLPTPVPPSVSLCRPGGGTGGTPSDLANFDPFDPTPRQTFVHWDGPFVRWLEANGYRVDYCTDLDLHGDGSLLRGYRLLVSAGHDEYWTDAMRDHAEAFVASGGNASFFGGNTCWWRVTFDDPCTFRRVGQWSDLTGPDRPENTLTGVSFRNGGERDADDHPIPVGYQVQHADHWIYEGTGLADGDRFGDRPGEYVVGYECDGAHFDRRSGGTVRPTGDDGTPESFVILGVGDTEPSGWGMGNRAATLGTFTNGGTVFTAATTDWARLLGRGHPAVQQITANVLDRLA